MSPRCTRKRMLHREGLSGSSSTSRTGSSPGSDRRSWYSKNYDTSSSRTKGQWARSAVVFMVLLVVGLAALLSLKTAVFLGASCATDAAGKEVSYSSERSIIELPNTGGP